MRGTIVIKNEAGRALRRKCVAVLAACVLDSAGSFRAGDRVYVSFRGKDGGQYVIAKGIVRCDHAVLQQIKGRSADMRSDPAEDDESDVVIREQDLELLWPSAGGID
ncbi:MAG TPA: PUA domain-containing protein [Xanthomonadaceae bacterium]|nr:PUA domain-containing protein [Xanthomonadaceae bacterium]